MIIKNAKVFTDENKFIIRDIYIKGARITEPGSDESEVLDGTGLYAIPGLTDLHFHGCAGYDFCNGTHEAIQAIADYEAENGITTILPATMALEDVKLEYVLKNAASYKSQQGAELIGIHMEGPYLSLAKKGAQKADCLKKPVLEHFQKMQTAADGRIRLVSIAPEEDGALEFITSLKDQVIFSLAHTTADYLTALKAFSLGASHVTHLYNAMPPFNHRNPGVIGAALDTPDCRVELICDGVHIHPSVIRATFQMFGDDRIILISDSMQATGMADGTYHLGGQEVTVSGNKATLTDQTLAGSVTNLMDCMKKAVSFGIPLTSAVKCAAVNPAKEIGIFENYGSITFGKFANIVLLDDKLNVKQVIIKGKKL